MEKTVLVWGQEVYENTQFGCEPKTALKNKVYLIQGWDGLYFVCLFLINLFIYLFMAVLGLRFCARAFSSCGERGPLFIAVSGSFTVAASPIAEHGLQTRRLGSCGSRA